MVSGTDARWQKSGEDYTKISGEHIASRIIWFMDGDIAPPSKMSKCEVKNM